ncbi:MAG: D-methionine transport system permease protein MetI [Chlamydiales bacterium]|nr:D-methionine transport system permease protein MetI [Chlamydiales bacterium]MCH9620160.1 D-methionine transport system permease protein MetI [Chlamydiales bacterium]MCH9623630.1 D-methionine transport system permease protein MetI [Chlamydiales bacterium]
MTNLELIWQLIPIELLNTLYMVFVSTLFAVLIGLPLGVYLFVTSSEGIAPARSFHAILGVIVNIGRSIPFAILIIAIFPFTRLIVGTSIGTTAAIVPLVIAAAPFFARIVETALLGVPKEITEAALVMGSTKKEIVLKVLIPEATPALIQGVTLTVVNLIGYSAMAGLVGGGGLGKIAIQYGYQRFNGTLMLITLILLLLLVETIQWIGNGICTKITQKRGL